MMATEKENTDVTSASSPDSPAPMNMSNAQVGSELPIPTHPGGQKADQYAAPYKVLKSQFPREFNSWRGSKHRAKLSSMAFADEFQKFGDFLRHVGPMPTPQHSLDRIDNEKGYVLGNVRWASKAQQSENRTSVRRYKVEDGPLIAQPALARAVGMSPDAFRKEISRGKSVEEILKRMGGKREFATQPRKVKPIYEWPWPVEEGDKWERIYKVNRIGEENRVSFLVRYCHERLSAVGQSCNDPYNLTNEERQETDFWIRMVDYAKVTQERARVELRMASELNCKVDGVESEQAALQSS